MTAFFLKMIAVIIMAIDHIGGIFFPQYIILRMIGRLSFPIFAFFVAEGARKTKSIERYSLNVLCFAILTEIPFDLAFSGKIFEWGGQNVMWNYVIALIGIAGYRHVLKRKRTEIQTYLSEDKEDYVILLFFCGMGMYLSYRMRTDYNWYGIVMIFLFYILHEKKIMKFVAVAGLTLFYSALYSIRLGYFFWGQYIQCYCIFSFLLLALYQGKQGRKWKYFFYLFYPMHLLVLYFIRIAL